MTSFCRFPSCCWNPALGYGKIFVQVRFFSFNIFIRNINDINDIVARNNCELSEIRIIDINIEISNQSCFSFKYIILMKSLS